MTIAAALFSGKRPDWETPDAFFAKLHSFYRFDLDVAASAGNAKTPRFFTQQEDGLRQSWAGARVWCNPPYGRGLCAWIDKAITERQTAKLIVMLLPARTDTQWFHRAVATAKPVFLKGRLRFKGASAPAPFPSLLLCWGTRPHGKAAALGARGMPRCG